MTYDEFSKKFYRIEKENQLFSWDFDGVYPWKLIRIYVFNDLIARITGNDTGHPNNANNSLRDIIVSKLTEYRFMMTSGVYGLRRHYDYVVLRHRRRVLVDGAYVEVNTEYMSQWFGDVSNAVFVETGLAFDKRNVQNDSTFAIASPIKLAIKRWYYSGKLDKIKDYLKEISKQFKNEFEIDIDFRQYLIRELAAYSVQYKLGCKLYKLFTPKEVILVCSYGKEGFIQSAKDQGIIVSEIQHGVITQSHTGYSFPETNIPYFPDKLYVYGDYWKDAANFPINKSNIIAVGSPYFDKQFNQFHGNKKDKNTILFISSGNIGKKLSKIALEIIAGNDFKIIYKLHPSEFGIWHELYPWLNDSDTEKIVVIEDGVNIFELYSKSDFIVGVNSTALYESFAFNCKMILVNLPGVDYMMDLISRYDIPVAANSDELVNLIKNYPKHIDVPTDGIYKVINR